MDTAGLQRKRLLESFGTDGLLRWSRMREQGITRRALIGLLDSGELVRAGRDLYRLADAPVARFAHWDEIGAKYPLHCICMLTAARHHGLTTQVPPQTWVGLPVGSKPSDPSVRCVQWPVEGPDGEHHRMWTLGVESVGDPGREHPVTGAARTLVDLCRWRERLEDGHRVFLEAVHEFAAQGRDRAELRRLAREFDCYGPIYDALQAHSEFTNRF